jgi:hypothetical protein
MELVREYFQRDENNLECLRQLDPEGFPNWYARCAQPRDCQPIGFDPDDAVFLLVVPPGTFKNILLYRGNYYVAPLGTEYPYVGLAKRMRGGNWVEFQVCFTNPPKVS